MLNPWGVVSVAPSGGGNLQWEEWYGESGGDEPLQAGKGYYATTITGDGNNVTSLPASPSSGDRVAITVIPQYAGFTNNHEINLNGNKYFGSEWGNRVIRPSASLGSRRYKNEVYVFEYVNADIGWVSNPFCPAAFWLSFTTWFDTAQLPHNPGAQAREIGFSRALYQCSETCGLSQEQRAIVNAVLPTFGLYGVA